MKSYYQDISLQGNELTDFSLEKLAAAPVTAYESKLYYDTSLSKVGYYNGSSWIYLDNSGGGGSMVYPPAGIPVSTGSAWGSSIADNSSNWNTAYGWGDHASAGYLTAYSEISTLTDVVGRGDDAGASFGTTNGYIFTGAIKGESDLQLIDSFLNTHYKFLFNNANNYYAQFSVVSLNANRTFAFPDTSGTIALTSDIPSLAGYLTSSTAASTYQPLDSDLTAIAALSTNGFAKKTGAGTWAIDTNTYLTSISGLNISDLINDSGYLTSISGLNISDLTNDSGYITSSALSPYLTSSTAASTYASLSGSYSNPSWITSLAWSKITGITGTPDGTKFLRDDGSWQTVAGGGGGSTALSSITGASASNSITHGANPQTWTWSLTSTTNAFGFFDSSSGAGSGYLLRVGTTSTNSNVIPFQVLARNSLALSISLSGAVTISNPSVGIAGGSSFIVNQPSTGTIPAIDVTNSSTGSGSQLSFIRISKNLNMTGGAIGYNAILTGYGSGLSTNAFVGFKALITTQDSGAYGGIFEVTGNANTTQPTGIYVRGAASVGAGSTAYGIYAVANGIVGTNIAGLFTASGGTNNYAIQISAGDISISNVNGSKIGVTTSQKLAFWNATPIVQPTTAVASATFAANTSGIVDNTATFDGYTIGQIVKALRNIGLLA